MRRFPSILPNTQNFKTGDIWGAGRGRILYTFLFLAYSIRRQLEESIIGFSAALGSGSVCTVLA